KPRDLMMAAEITILVEAAFLSSSRKIQKSARQSSSYPQLPCTCYIFLFPTIPANKQQDPVAVTTFVPQPDGQQILGCDLMCKSGIGITNIPVDYPEEPLPHCKDHDITKRQHQCLVKAVKEHICKRIHEVAFVCINPCLLNKLLVDLTFPILTIHSIISKVQGYFIASALDLISLYMFVAVIFGIKIFTQHFQHLVDVVIAADINNLAVFQSVKEHIKHLKGIIHMLTAMELCICQQ
ncbi:hypothetical protein QOT17_013328, partial [Balamuthia mandrillaris]